MQSSHRLIIFRNYRILGNQNTVLFHFYNVSLRLTAISVSSKTNVLNKISLYIDMSIYNLQLMLKVSAFSWDARAKAFTPFVTGFVNDILLQCDCALTALWSVDHCSSVGSRSTSSLTRTWMSTMTSLPLPTCRHWVQQRADISVSTTSLRSFKMIRDRQY